MTLKDFLVTHIDRHLVHMDTFLNTEFRHQHVECSIQDTNDSSLPNDRTVLLGQVRNECTEVQMGGLFLGKSSAVVLAVEVEMLGSVRNLDGGSPYMLHC
jgi:hypothetical protein